MATLYFLVVIRQRRGPMVYRRRVPSLKAGDRLMTRLTCRGLWADGDRFEAAVLGTTDPDGFAEAWVGQRSSE